ncbi:potassium channel family protein [Psychromicrobium xiongbiense]|uniref:potassium channel family protein n=1 Tax=Psychromicrobium xiongbiense TaxID=3051184 RepID=UPI0025537ED8|nr:potassium channel family protein [Psychromicrobium sp. YIM S02556]
MTFERWRRLTEWPLIITSAVFLAAYSVQVLTEGEISAAADAVVTATWVMFVIDYVVTLILVPQRGRWFIRHLYELAIVVLPALRPLRLLRLITLISVFHRVAGNALRGKVVVYVVATSVLLVYVGALAMYDAEKDTPTATIKTFGDALWWSVVTITTVGYGDLSPHTIVGRLIAVGLMIGGIALIGIVTATLASWLVEQVTTKDAKAQAATMEHVEMLLQEIRALRREIGAHPPTAAPATPGSADSPEVPDPSDSHEQPSPEV